MRGMGKPTLGQEAALQGLAALKNTGVGRKSNEKREKEKQEVERNGEVKDRGTRMAAGELASEFEISVDDVISPPGEVVDYRQSLEGEKPEVLRGRLTKAAFENKGLRRWINQVMKQLQEAKRGGNISIATPPSGLLSEAGVSDDSEGALKVLKAMAPYLMMKDLFKEDSGEESKSRGVIRYESADGEKYEYPAGSFPPGYNPFFGNGKQGKGDGDEKTVTIKIGENEITGPPSYVSAMVPIVMAQQRQGEEGSSGGAGTKALEQVIEIQKMLLERQQWKGDEAGGEERREKMVTVMEEDGKSVEIPGSIYPQYMMMQSLVKQQKIMAEQQRQALHRESPGKETATVYAALAKMDDTIRQIAAAMDPERLGANTLKGLRGKIDEWNEMRTFLGGSGEDSEVMKERIRAQEETRRKEIEENTKLARELEKTKQAELDARKFDMIMNPQHWGAVPQQQVPQQVQVPLIEEEEDEPRVTEDEAYVNSKEVNKRFLEGLEAERAERAEGRL